MLYKVLFLFCLLTDMMNRPEVKITVKPTPGYERAVEMAYKP